MKKILSLFMLVMCIAVGANAQNSGTTANGLEWSVENDVLTITGSGAINNNEAPWGTSFSTVVIGEDVTSIGANAFKNCFNIKSVFYSGNSSIFGKFTIFNVFNGVAIEDIAFYRSPSSSNLISKFTGYFKANASNEILWTLLNGVFTAKSDKAMTENGDLEGIDELASYAPDDMLSISTISVEGATALVSENGALLSSDRSKFLLACNKSGLTVVVPETVERIGAYAFYAAPSIIVKSLSATAPALSNNSFNAYLKMAQLILPNNTPATVGAYSAWSEYFTVVKTDDMPSSGAIGNVSWSISNKVLTIAGSGELVYSGELRESCSYFGVNEVRVESGITEIANNAFYQNTASKYTFYYNAKISGTSGISDDATLNLVLADKVDLAANVNTFDKVTLNRTFAANSGGTLILPFEAVVPNGMKVYKLKSFSNKVMQFEEVNTIAANTPYVWRSTKNVSSISSLEKTTKTTLNHNDATTEYAGTTVDDWTLYGVLNSKTISAEKPGVTSDLWIYVGSTGQFKNYDAVKVAPYRAYLKGWAYNEVFSDAANNINASFPERSLSIEFIDMDGTTSIEEVVVDREGNISSSADDGVYYDLSGRRVENPTSGIYIVNGKKVLVK